MAALLIDWIYIFFICTGMGAWLYPLVSRRKSLFFLLLTGMFAEMVTVWIFTFFFPAGESFYLINSLLAFAAIFVFRKNLREIFLTTTEDFKGWKPGIKFTALFLLILVLMQSSTATLIVDNDSYYTSSISWLNHFGMVPGLINLHPFLGQMSGWHILQSGVNFGFISHSLNAINGFLLLGVTLFSLSKLNSYFTDKEPEDLFMGLLPVANIFLFQFVSAPSPDLPVFLMSQIIFYLFYRDFQKGEDYFRMILILILFLILVKTTVFPLLILPLTLWFKRKRNTAFLLILSTISFSLFVAKNYIITGYPLYPSPFFGNLFSPDWQFPEEVYKYMRAQSRFVGMGDLESRVPLDTSEWFFLKNWLFTGGPRSILNGFMVLLLILFPFFIRKNKALIALYVYALIQFFVLYFSLPQYRFFMPLILGISLFLLSGILRKLPTLLMPSLLLFAFLPLVPLLIPLPISSLSHSNQITATTPVFKTKYVLTPHPNSDINRYSQHKEGNLIYYSPEGESVFFWSSGDAPGACVTREKIDYFKNRYKIRPQLRKKDLSGGFFSEKQRK